MMSSGCGSAADRPRCWAVVVAAGCGSRMRLAEPKQFLRIEGKSILEYTLRPLLQEERIGHIVLSLPAGQSNPMKEQAAVSTVVGGSSRAASVMAALQSLQDHKVREQDWVLVHDGVRPCLSSACLQHFLDTLWHHPVGGLLAVPVVDTLKKAANGDSIATIPRQGLWHAQTPQMFRFKLFFKALSNTINKELEHTDDASALEELGYFPRLIPGERDNRKLTTDEDLHWFFQWLKNKEDLCCG